MEKLKTKKKKRKEGKNREGRVRGRKEETIEKQIHTRTWGARLPLLLAPVYSQKEIARSEHNFIRRKQK
jgi:hypothetical protein